MIEWILLPSINKLPLHLEFSTLPLPSTWNIVAFQNGATHSSSLKVFFLQELQNTLRCDDPGMHPTKNDQRNFMNGTNSHYAIIVNNSKRTRPPQTSPNLDLILTVSKSQDRLVFDWPGCCFRGSFVERRQYDPRGLWVRCEREM